MDQRELVIIADAAQDKTGHTAGVEVWFDVLGVISLAFGSDNSSEAVY